jgi:ABC-2 type transport system permease protein
MYNTYLTLLAKEWIESLRTSRLLIWTVIGVFFGILSPLSAYFLPEILSLVGATENIIITIGSIGYQDALKQYIKNFTQIGTIVVIILYMGSIAQEKSDGSLSFLLVRPVDRISILLAKITGAKIIIAIGQGAAILCMTLYSRYLFPDFPIARFIVANLFLFIYFLTIAVITISLSAMVTKPIIAAIGSLGFWILFSVIAMSRQLGNYSFTQVSDQMMQMTEGFPVSYTPTIGALVLMIVVIGIAYWRFSRWECTD